MAERQKWRSTVPSEDLFNISCWNLEGAWLSEESIFLVTGYYFDTCQVRWRRWNSHRPEKDHFFNVNLLTVN